MAGPTQLDIYRYALSHLADARLATIGDDVESKYALDDAWPRAVDYVLRQAPWRFALVSATLASGGTPAAGYASAYAFPAFWLRTHAIYIAQNGRELPFDLREQNTVILTNIATAPTMRFVSAQYTDPLFSNGWPEQFAQALGAYLAFLIAYRVTGNPGAPAKMSQIFSELLDEAKRLDAMPEDSWLPYQRDGSFLRVSRAMIDQGFWLFALKTVHVTTVAGGMGGLSRQADIPADWSRSRSLYVLASDGQRRPFNIREQGDLWLTNDTAFYAEYVSTTLAMDSTKWPDHYMRAVLRALHFDEATRSDEKDQKDDLGIAKDALADTLDSEAIAPDPWLNYQLDGSFARGSQAVIAKGYWWFALKTLDIDTSTQEVARADNGFPYRFALPTDWLKTHSLYVSYGGTECPFDIRETRTHWSTDAPFFTARYVSTDALDPTLWPEPVAQAVLAYLDWQGAEPQKGEEQIEAAEYQALLGSALADYSLPEDPWLRFQTNGRYLQAVKVTLEKGRWRFSTRTVDLTDLNNTGFTSTTTPVPGDPTSVSDGSVSPGYTCRMLLPNDWLRTVRVTYSYVDGWRPVWADIDFRDELDALHCNYNPIRLHYVSRLGLDSTRWPSNFRDAVLAFLEYVEARADPKMGAIAKERFSFWQLQCREAENLDDERDMPVMNNTGRFVAARYGSRWCPNGSSGANHILTASPPPPPPSPPPPPPPPPPPAGGAILTGGSDLLTGGGDILTGGA